MTKGLETKNKLIEAATELFHKNGVHWVSFQQIGTQVGLSQPALYRHFKDKDDLVQACIIHMAEIGRDIIDKNVDQHSSAAQQLYKYIEGNFIWIQKRPIEAPLLVALYYFGFNNKPIQNLMKTINDQSVTRLAVRLSAGNNEGCWKLEDPAAVARVIHDMLMGEVIKAVHHPKEMTPQQRAQLLWSSIELMTKFKKSKK